VPDVVVGIFEGRLRFGVCDGSVVGRVLKVEICFEFLDERDDDWLFRVGGEGEDHKECGE
jgi:hypothetical protein